MDLPDVKAGMAIMAEHIQRLNTAIRQVQLRPGIGYFLKQNSGGTSLVIPDRQSATGGGGSGSVIPCPFECTDASEQDTLKVQVQWGLIYQMLPTGMYPDNDPPLKLTVTQSCFLCSKITFNTNTLLVSEIKFEIFSDLPSNTSSSQYNVLARIVVDADADPKIISSITNFCIQPFPSPCALAPQSS